MLTIYELIVTEFDMDFVRAFFGSVLSYMAFDPPGNRKGRSYLAKLATVNKLFLDIYRHAIKHVVPEIVFPHLDALFDRLSTEYDRWKPAIHGTRFTPFLSVIKYNESPSGFNALCGIEPIVDRACFMAWLGQHRYALPMSEKEVGEVCESLEKTDWISWVQKLMKADLPFNGRSWKSHQIPTLICLIFSSSHRCIDYAIEMLACLWSSDRDRQRELLLVVLLYVMVTSVWSRHVTMAGDVWAFIDTLMRQDKSLIGQISIGSFTYVRNVYQFSM